MSASLSGRSVLITGASSGIGRAAALAFAEAGAHVLGIARNAPPLAELSTALGGPPRIRTFTADVADAASMDHLARQVQQAAGTPDVIVANAGVGLDALFVETTDEALRTLFETNVIGVVRTIRPHLPGMIARASGRIVIVSSIVGKRGIPHYSGYSASKFALHGLADALRVELWGTGVTVGVICPTSTRTGFHDRMQHAGPRQRFVRPRRHPAEAVAAAIVSMARSRSPERVLTVEGKLMAFGDALAPRLLDAILARVLKSR